MKKKVIQLVSLVLVFLLLIIAVVWMRVNRTTKSDIKSQSSTDLEEKITAENEEKVEQAVKDGIPSIVMSNASAEPGDKITLTASLVNNPGILGMSLTISYNEEIMELVSVKNGEAVSDVLELSNSNTLKSGCVFLWDGEDITPDQTHDGEVLVLEFKISGQAPAGKTPVMLISDQDGTVDRDLQPLSLNINSGFITVVE